MSIFLLAGGSGSLTAQTVSGKVVNTEQQPIDGATIILQTSDSTFVDATISNADGNFVFNHQPEAYRLIFQHILYHTIEKKAKKKMQVSRYYRLKTMRWMRLLYKGNDRWSR